MRLGGDRKTEPANSPWIVYPNTATLYSLGNHQGIYNAAWGTGNTVATGWTITYEMKANTCYMQFMPRQDSGYCDAYLILNDGNAMWVNRIQLGAEMNNGPPGLFAGGTNQVPSVIVCVTSNFPNATHIQFRPQKGIFLKA